MISHFKGLMNPGFVASAGLRINENQDSGKIASEIACRSVDKRFSCLGLCDVFVSMQNLQWTQEVISVR